MDCVHNPEHKHTEESSDCLLSEYSVCVCVYMCVNVYTSVFRGVDVCLHKKACSPMHFLSFLK